MGGERGGWESRKLPSRFQLRVKTVPVFAGTRRTRECNSYSSPFFATRFVLFYRGRSNASACACVLNLECVTLASREFTHSTFESKRNITPEVHVPVTPRRIPYRITG